MTLLILFFIVHMQIVIITVPNNNKINHANFSNFVSNIVCIMSLTCQASHVYSYTTTTSYHQEWIPLIHHTAFGIYLQPPTRDAI